MVRRFVRCEFCYEGRALGVGGRGLKCFVCHGRGRVWIWLHLSRKYVMGTRGCFSR